MSLVLPQLSEWEVVILCPNNKKAKLFIIAGTMLEAACEAHYETKLLLHSPRAITSIRRTDRKPS